MLLQRWHLVPSSNGSSNKRRAFVMMPSVRDMQDTLALAIEAENTERIDELLNAITQYSVNMKIIWGDINGIHNVQSVSVAAHLLPSIFKDDPRSRIPVCWLIRAAKNGNMAMVYHMLSIDQAFIRGEHHLALCRAAYYNQAETVKALLQDGRFDPAWANNDALTCAAMQGHLTCVNLLLDDPRVIPYDCDNRALAYAADAGHCPVVDVLMEQDGVDPRGIQDRAIRWSAKNGHFDVLRKLLSCVEVERSIRY